MATTPLSSYLKDIEGMIGTVQNNEAIAHCLHILETFPKNIPVYRLLGKAYLENQRFSDAADVFQRVLSAVPDDFVANIGMSIIREDEGNYDAAIWHMERSFEAQPYNSAIQDELRRLYGRRDGMEPPKMRLTRGALARLYAKGNLYQQAIGELRAALAEDPQRPDLQVLLARYYFLAGYRVEAVETCSTLLKKLPYSLEANTLLSIILPETERAKDAPNYLQRAISLDPYYAQTSMTTQPTELGSINSIVVKRLSITPDVTATEESKPAWATALGVVLKEPSEGEILPAWLTQSVETTLALESEATTGETTPFSESKLTDNLAWESPSEEIIPASEETSIGEIPEWMQEAGWGLATGEVKEGPETIFHEEETIDHVESKLAPAEIPDWLRDAAPPGILDQVEPSELHEEDNGKLLESPEDEIPAWLKETIPTSEGGYVEKTSEWNKEDVSGTEFTSDQATSIPELTLDMENEIKEVTSSSTESEIPEWLEEIETSQATEEVAPSVMDEIPEWLKDDISENETPVADAEQFTISADEIPGLLAAEETTPEIPEVQKTLLEDISTELDQVKESPAEVSPEEISNVEGGTTIEELPDRLKEGEVDIPEEAGKASELKGVTEWLDSVNTGDLATGSIGITEWLSKLEPGAETPTEKTTPAPTEIFPWLREAEPDNKEVVTDEIQEAAEPEKPGDITPITDMAPAAPADEIPEWIKEIKPVVPDTTTAEPGETNIPEQEIVLGEFTPAFEQDLPFDVDVSEQEAALTWLEGLDIKRDLAQDVPPSETEGTKEILLTRDEEVPSEVPSSLSEELPEWLKTSMTEGQEGVETDLTEVVSLGTEEPSTLFVEEIPDSLVGAFEVPEAGTDELHKGAEGEGQESALPEESILKAEAVSTPTAGEIPEKLEKAISDEQETHIIDIQETIISEALRVGTGEVQEDTFLDDSSLPEEIVSTLDIEEIPDWLKETSSETQETAVIEVKEQITPEVSATTTEEIPPPSIEEIPDWLEEAAAEGQEISVSDSHDIVEVVGQETPLPEEIAIPSEIISKDVTEETPDLLIEAIEIDETPEAISTPTVEELPDWLKETEGREIKTVEEEAAPSEISSQPSEWIKETELPDWLAETVEPTEGTNLEPPQTSELISPEKTTDLTIIYINNATVSDLESLPGLGSDSAQNIVNNRETHGLFTSIEDLLGVPGISPENIEALKDWVTIESLGTKIAIKEGVPSPDSDHLILQQAHQAMQRGEIQVSIDQYNLLLKKTVLLKEIIVNLQDALYRYPVDMSIWQTLGDAYLRNNQLQEAMDAYTKAEELLR